MIGGAAFDDSGLYKAVLPLFESGLFPKFELPGFLGGDTVRSVNEQANEKYKFMFPAAEPTPPPTLQPTLQPALQPTIPPPLPSTLQPATDAAGLSTTTSLPDSGGLSELQQLQQLQQQLQQLQQ